MNIEEQVEFWERVAGRKQREHDALWGKNPTSPTAPIAYLNDVLPYKILLRRVYEKAGRPVCWGLLSCLEQAYQKCSAGNHETCQTHVNTCLLCNAENQGK